MPDLRRRAFALSVVTVAYNVAEGLVSVAAGVSAGSVALVGFGLDSFVESLSGGIMLWRFRRGGAASASEERGLDEKAERLVGYTFLLLGAYVLYDAAQALLRREAPDPSLLGIVVAVLSLIIMPLLAWAKIRTARALGSRALLADATETIACSWLSLGLLLGLGLNYLAGLWWADPVVGILVAVFLFREGREILGGEDEDDDEEEAEAE